MPDMFKSGKCIYNMCMRKPTKKKMIAAFMVLGILLGGCGTQKQPEATPAPTAEPEPTPVPLIFLEGEKERVGRKGVGFIDIPAGWCDGSGNPRYQDNNLLYLDDYSDFHYIVSMKSVLLREQRKQKIQDISDEELMNQKVQELEEKYAGNIEDSHHVTDTVADLPAEKCWFSVNDGTVHYCWIFRDPQKSIHYIEVRTKGEEASLHAAELAELVLSSFDLNK